MLNIVYCVFTWLQKLFKAKKAYIMGEEHAKGYGKVGMRREDKWYKGGDQEGSDGCDGVQGGGAGWGWGHGMCWYAE